MRQGHRRIENNAIKALKGGCHPEHSRGQGNSTLSNLPAASNMTAFLFQSAARRRQLNDIRVFTSRAVHEIRDAAPTAVITGELSENPQRPKPANSAAPPQKTEPPANNSAVPNGSQPLNQF